MVEKFFQKLIPYFWQLLYNQITRCEVQEGALKAKMYLVGGVIRIDIPITRLEGQVIETETDLFKGV